MVKEFGMPHCFKTLTVDEMTSTRWLEFNDIKYLVKQIHKTMSCKECTVECATLFHSHVNMFMHQHILKDNDILGKIKEYVICYELQHHGSIHAHIILWVNENDLQRITNEITTFIPVIFDKITKTFIPPNDSLQFNFLKMVL
jgi:hypothetical protein